jgi:hypothetical protein
LIEALNEVMKLRAEWYKLPKGEKVDEKPEDAEEQKND